MSQTPEEIKAKRKAYYEKNKTKILAYLKQYTKEHPEVNRKATKKYYQGNKEERLAWFQNRRKTQYEQVRNIEKRARLKNGRNRLQEYTRQKERYNTDIEYRLKTNLRNRLRKALYSCGPRRSLSTKELIGCTPHELKIYLESKFLPKMSWDNYGNQEGNWVIDHIIPIASFTNLLDLEQQKKCFHYTNLQPLWMEDNLIKGSKLLKVILD